MPDDAIVGSYATGVYVGSFQFRVTVEGINDPLDGFTKISEIKKTIEPVEFRTGVNPMAHQGLGRTKVEAVTVERAYQGVDDLYQWFEVCTRERDARTVTIDFLKPNGDTVRRYILLGAWPSEWTLPAMDAGSSQVGIEKCKFVCENVIQE